MPASAGQDLSPISCSQVSSAGQGDDMLRLSDIGADFDVGGGQDYLKAEGDEDEEREMDEAGEFLCCHSSAIRLCSKLTHSGRAVP